MNKLVIVGDSAFAEVAHNYFEAESPYEVVGFAVEEEFRTASRKFDKPLVSFESLESSFDPNDHFVFVAITYLKLNRVRTRLAKESKAKGFRLASFISHNAFVAKDVAIGEHCFIFEQNIVQPFATIGNNVILWSGNHIGHHSRIEDNCFISSHVVLSGFCEVGKNSFVGVNATVSNNVRIGDDNWLGPGTLIQKDTQRGQIFQSKQTQASKVPVEKFFGRLD